MKRTQKAFTLVELIVVITILAILGTIAFVSLQSYTSFARNAIRLDATRKIVSNIKNLTTSGIKITSFTNTWNEVPGATISGTWAIVWVDYISWTPNYTALWIKRADFLDPLTWEEYILWIVTRKGWRYEITASLEEGTEFEALVVWNWESRNATNIPGSWLSGDNSFTVSNVTDLGVFTQWDYISSDTWEIAQVSNISNDWLTYFLSSSLTSDAISFSLASSEVAWLIVSQDGVNPVVDGSATLLAYGWSSSSSSSSSSSTSSSWWPLYTIPTNLAISHTEWSRNFSVTWTAWSGVSAAWWCKLQYNANETTWTDVSGTYDCDTDATSQAATFPATDNWTNNFDGTWVQLRLALVDETQLDIFTNRATCTSWWASWSSTPNYDEDCDGRWDNTSSNPTYTTVNCPSTSSNGSFSTWVTYPVITTPASSSCVPSTYSSTSITRCRFNTAPAPYTSYLSNGWTCDGSVFETWSQSLYVHAYISWSSVTPTGPLEFLDHATLYSPQINLGSSGCVTNILAGDHTLTVPSTFNSYSCTIRYNGVPNGSTTVYN